jgi:hypothetical protein
MRDAAAHLSPRARIKVGDSSITERSRICDGAACHAALWIACQGVVAPADPARETCRKLVGRPRGG